MSRLTDAPRTPEDRSTAPPDPRLAGLLSQVLDGEPPIGDGVDVVYRRADAIRRRRVRNILLAGVAAVVVVALLGYGLTTAVLPSTPVRKAPAAATSPAAVRDAVLDVLRPVVEAKDLRILPRPQARGAGWRQYTVADAEGGRPRGLIEVSVYAAPDGICFPVRADPDACARPERVGDLEYVRYADDTDVDWQWNQTIARRMSDGRVVVVMATGERGTGDADAGRPPLTGRETGTSAVDVRMFRAFGADELCTGADPECPVLKVPMPTR